MITPFSFHTILWNSSFANEACYRSNPVNSTQVLSALKKFLQILVAPVLLIGLPHCGPTHVIVSGKVRQLQHEEKAKYRQMEEILGEDLYPGELSSVFQVLDREIGFSQIPVCAYSAPRPSRDRGEKPLHAMSYTGRNGSFGLKLPRSRIAGTIVVANGGEDKAERCGFNAQIKFREDIKGSHSVLTEEDLVYADGKSINVELIVSYDGALLALQREVDTLVNQLAVLSLAEIMQLSETLVGLESAFAAQYPKSSRVTRNTILSIAERVKQRQADEAYQMKEFETALALYSDLVRFFPLSPSADKNTERMAHGKLRLQQQQAYELLMKVVRAVPSRSRAIGMLEKYLTEMSGDDPYRILVTEKIEELRTDLGARKIASERREAERRQQRADDDAALRQYDVDLSITQLDLFTNSLAYRDKHVAISCAIVRFETRTSAVMRGADTFYADFKIPPPTTSALLSLIAKVVGVTELIGEDGRRSRVPHLEVVHILNKMP